MAKSRNKAKTTINKYVINPADGVRILNTHITKNRDEYDFYDIQVGDVIIKGASIVSGKKGDFLGMPSKERNGEWYPVVYISHNLGDELMSYIEDADDNDEWEEVDNDDYLMFEEKKATGRGKSKKSRGGKTCNKKNNKNDEEDEDGDDEDDGDD